ncbi:MAG: hypothetical protein VW907_10220 [Opitutae bacterium]
MKSLKEQLCNDIVAMVIEKCPEMIIVETPSIFPCAAQKNGWTIGVGLEDHDSVFYDLIDLMLDSLSYWEDDDLKAAIKGTEKLLQKMKEEWNEHGDGSKFDF